MKTTRHDVSYNDEPAIIPLRLMLLTLPTPPTQPSPISMYPPHSAEYRTTQKNKKVTMQHPVTAPAWTRRTVPVHLPRPVRSSRHSSTGWASGRRDKTAPDPVESVSLVTTSRMRDRPLPKLPLMPWRWLP